MFSQAIKHNEVRNEAWLMLHRIFSFSVWHRIRETGDVCETGQTGRGELCLSALVNQGRCVYCKQQCCCHCRCCALFQVNSYQEKLISQIFLKAILQRISPFVIKCATILTTTRRLSYSPEGHPEKKKKEERKGKNKCAGKIREAITSKQKHAKVNTKSEPGL